MKNYVPRDALVGLTPEQAEDVKLLVHRGACSAREAREIVLRPKRKVRAPTMEELIAGARHNAV